MFIDKNRYHKGIIVEGANIDIKACMTKPWECLTLAGRNMEFVFHHTLQTNRFQASP